MQQATFLAVVCAAILMLPASDAEAYSDAWVHAHCTTAMRIARDENVKMTDTKFLSWKVEDSWYEEHRDPSETGDEWAQFRCSIAAQCPEISFPHNRPSSPGYIHATWMLYDDPRRNWLHTSFSGSVTEVQKTRCTEGGYLR